MFINFSDIPGHSNLFLDYLYEFNNVKDFYKTNFRDKEEYLKHFKKISESGREFRGNISSILSRQYGNSNVSEKTRRNISLMGSKNTLAVVTGQQLGLFGGPLYTIYKIITALKLSRHLSEKYDEYNFIPVFWLEGDDHDFEEVSYLNLINENNELIKIQYPEQLPEEGNMGSIGFLKFSESINQVFENVEKNLRPTEFTPDLLANLKRIYSPGKSFKESFREMLLWLFDEYGLVIIDPQDKEIKDILRPVFRKEIEGFRTHSEKLINVSAVLEEKYHAQVKIRAVNLFYNYDEGRYLIEPVENDFRLRRKRKKFTREELLNLIDIEPEKFSPNVLLRPVCQDYLLPTAFYVGGPGEIAYFAQAMPLYEFYSVNFPLVYPRSSVTLLEKSIDGLLEKYSLEPKDVFIMNGDLKNKILGSVSSNSTDEIFKETENKFDLAMDQLKEKLIDIDKTISDSSSRYKQKIISYLGELKTKAVEAQNRKHEVTIRQSDRIMQAIFPQSSLQEREINVIYFMNKYGPEIIRKLYEGIEINKFEHQVIKI
jgi:bacillithiol synthase